MKYRKRQLVVALALVTLITGCVHESLVPESPEGNPSNPVNDTCDPQVAYYNEVQDILLTNCAMSGCHDQQTAEDGVILNSYNNVMNSDVVRPNNPGNSDLYEVLIEDDPDDRMPRDRAPLSQDQIALIAQWIAQGAKNVTCNSVDCATENISYDAHIRPLIGQKCGSCHSGNSPSGGVNLSSYAGVKAVADEGRLYGAVSHAQGFTPMPYGGQKLADCQVEMIRIWVENGALNN